MIRTVVSDALLSASLLIVVLSAVGALTMRTTFGRLHYVAPVTTVAGPLFGAAAAVRTGWGITAGLEILIVVIMALSGPVLEIATGRAEAQQQGVLTPESPS
ncbi:MAG TPA: monovalent cation/H(+) antiporter subunit G [Mycobacteriales bacterium]|nr:monovalent cation/H(+) antiporter subunit G [Mycobacteriales bacterium]